MSKGRLSFFDAYAQQRLELARVADWRPHASYTWRVRGRTGRDITILALNGLGCDLALAEDALLVLALGGPRTVIGEASAVRWREILGLDDAQCKLAKGLTAGADPLELALLSGLAPEAFDGRLNALCARLGVNSSEAARALLASVVRPN